MTPARNPPSPLATPRRRRRPVPSETHRPPEDDSWVDVVADEAASLLTEDGLDLELIVFYDPLTETLHAVGYDGAPARYFRSLEANLPRARASAPEDERSLDVGGSSNEESKGGPSGPSSSTGGDRAILPMTAMAGTALAIPTKENRP